MKKLGILFIHGLFGSPREFDGLIAQMTEAGYLCDTVTLPGHGASPEQFLKDVLADDLLAHCLEEYEVFKNKSGAGVVVVGHSLGGICALLMGAAGPVGLQGVVSLAAPYESAYTVNQLTGLLGVPLNTLLPGLRFLPEHHTGYERPVFLPWDMIPLRKQAALMLESLQEQLPQVSVPVLLAHSVYDLTIPYAEMAKIEKALEGTPSRVVTCTLQDCGHQIYPCSGEQVQVTKHIFDFLAQCSGENMYFG